MTEAPDDRKLPHFATDNLVRRIFSPPKRLLSKYVSSGSSVADLGCGPGYFTIPMAELTGPGGKVYAVDFDAGAVEHLAAMMRIGDEAGRHVLVAAHYRMTDGRYQGLRHREGD
ncbi:MAG: methyltransferase domain-containing protein, partial [Nitrososphaerota archaeon]|nr:methyltransferase domain-containing protein [Nitrososphaerota archaeon]